MSEIEEIQHTADKAINVKAETLEELLRGTLIGMAQIQLYWSCKCDTACKNRSGQIVTRELFKI